LGCGGSGLIRGFPVPLLPGEYQKDCMADKTKRVEFAPPEEFHLPESALKDGSFELVCEFRVKPDGKICLTKLGDQNMPGYDSNGEADDEHRPDYGNMTRGIQEGMNMDGGNAPGPRDY